MPGWKAALESIEREDEMPTFDEGKGQPYTPEEEYQNRQMDNAVQGAPNWDAARKAANKHQAARNAEWSRLMCLIQECDTGKTGPAVFNQRWYDGKHPSAFDISEQHVETNRITLWNLCEAMGKDCMGSEIVEFSLELQMWYRDHLREAVKKMGPVREVVGNEHDGKWSILHDEMWIGATESQSIAQELADYPEVYGALNELLLASVNYLKYPASDRESSVMNEKVRIAEGVMQRIVDRVFD